MTPSAPPDEWSSRRYPIAENMAFQRRSWAIQRIGWGGMAVLIVAALCGGFAAGPLSTIERSAAGGQLAVKAERFLRVGRGAQWQVTLQPREGSAELRLNAALLGALTIENIQPQPDRAGSAEGGLRLTYEVAPGDDRPLVVRIWARPTKAGAIAAEIGSGAGARVGIDHFVFP